MEQEIKLSDFPSAPDRESSTRDYQSRFGGKVGRWLLARQEKLTLRAVSLLEKELGRKLRLLDVGGGHAQNVDVLAASGHELVVLGSDEECGALVREKARERVTYQVGSLLALPFDAGAFDLVISYRILAHVGDWKAYIAEMSRVARLGILIDYPCFESANIFSSLFYEMKNKVEKNTRYYRVFHKSQMRRECAQAGLTLDRSWGQFFAPMALHRALNFVPISALMEKIFQILMLSRFFGSPLIELYRKRQSG